MARRQHSQDKPVRKASPGRSEAETKGSGKPVPRMWFERHRYFSPAGGPSLTKQSFKDEVDINKIMSKFMQTGQINHLNRAQPNYGVATATDFREALEIVRNGDETFMNLPSEIRAKFNQNPEEFLAFVENPENVPEMENLGLLETQGQSHPPVSEKDQKPPTGQTEASQEASPSQQTVDSPPQEGHS